MQKPPTISPKSPLALEEKSRLDPLLENIEHAFEHVRRSRIKRERRIVLILPDNVQKTFFEKGVYTYTYSRTINDDAFRSYLDVIY